MLYKEVKYDHKTAFTLLLSGGDPNYSDSQNGNSLLHEIASGKKSEDEQRDYNALIELLIKCGANTEYRNYQGLTAEQLAQSEGNSGIASVIQKADKNKHIYHFDSKRSEVATAITSQKIEHVTDPTKAIDSLTEMMYSGLDIEQPFNKGSASPLELAKQNWPKEQSDALEQLAACVKVTNDFLERADEREVFDDPDNSDSIESQIRKQIQGAWGDRINPLIDYNNYSQGKDRGTFQ